MKKGIILVAALFMLTTGAGAQAFIAQQNSNQALQNRTVDTSRNTRSVHREQKARHKKVKNISDTTSQGMNSRINNFNNTGTMH